MATEPIRIGAFWAMAGAFEGGAAGETKRHTGFLLFCFFGSGIFVDGRRGTSPPPARWGGVQPGFDLDEVQVLGADFSFMVA